MTPPRKRLKKDPPRATGTPAGRRPDSAPYLAPGDRLTSARLVTLIREIRSRKGGEVWLKRCNTYGTTSVTGSHMRATFGDAFHVRRSGYDLFVRARLVGEPVFDGSDLDAPDSAWMSVKAAAAYAGLHVQDFRRGYLDNGKIRRFVYGTRAAVLKDDVHAMFRYNKPPGGVFAHTGKSSPKVVTL